ncbi:DNA gyrase inhibitor YacG [Undibacterium griseum]|uniref:DNA gyrase inhibitor YacG n=1 Tax=Undibacterium griseum TaxID=2762295 RepID=A0ABR6YNK3_9BURK|nr:DNA gyrase inhibitor YacG [Undibacterium griseum]MBC3885480.1 DNA gyrase inhibitor YacG [Undibacterium griseum]
MVTKVNCPTCHEQVEWVEASRWRPFCSERCKQIDLGAWAEEKYSIPAVNLPEDPNTDASLNPDA